MELTLHVSEELAWRLRPVQDRIPQILELGLRELNTAPPRFEGLADVLEFLAHLPPPQEVLALRPSPALQERISTLLNKLGSSGLSADEERDWQNYQYIEHLVRIAKARAALQLNSSETP